MVKIVTCSNKVKNTNAKNLLIFTNGFINFFGFLPTFTDLYERLLIFPKRALIFF